MKRSASLFQLPGYVIFWICTVGTAHGNTVSPPWITLRGCFNYSSGNGMTNIQKNEPTQCLKSCSGFTKVGLKNTSCICNPSNNYTRVNRLCNLTCPGTLEVNCGSEGVGDDLMSVYTTYTPLPDGFNGSTNYGYGYVVVSGRNKSYYASNDNLTLTYGYLCYNDFTSSTDSPCQYDKSTLLTWKEAVKACKDRSSRLMPASDIERCQIGSAFDGTYWIGTYRDNPNSITSTHVPTDISKVSSTTTPRSEGKPTTYTSTGSTYANTTTRGPSMEATEDASGGDDDTIKIGIVGGVLIILVVVSVVVCRIKRLLCFKH